MFLFYSVRGRKQLPSLLWQKDPFQCLFCSLTSLIFRISPRELWVLSFLSVSWGGSSVSPPSDNTDLVRPHPALFSLTPASFPLQAPAVTLQEAFLLCHYLKTLLEAPPNHVDKAHGECGSSWLFARPPVGLPECPSLLITVALPVLLHSSPCPSNWTTLRIPCHLLFWGTQSSHMCPVGIFSTSGPTLRLSPPSICLRRSVSSKTSPFRPGLFMLSLWPWTSALWTYYWFLTPVF